MLMCDFQPNYKLRKTHNCVPIVFFLIKKNIRLKVIIGIKILLSKPNKHKGNWGQ